MGWIMRTEPPTADPHEFCDKPTRNDGRWGLLAHPDGTPGDLWRCDECGKLWVVSSWNHWREAGWWLRFVHRSEGVPGQ